MSYALHITRRHQEGPANSISRGEWLEYLNHDPEFRQIDAVESINPKTGATIRIPGDALAEWIAQREPGPTFNYFEGGITVGFRGKDHATLHKMKEVATALDAQVIGQEGEEY